MSTFIQKKHSWQLPDSAVTPQSQYLGRRQFLRTCGLGLAAGALLPAASRAATFGFPDALNAADKLPGVKVTPYDNITGYNNFYEWGFDKEDPKVNANQGWKTEPWTVEIGGLCAKPGKIRCQRPGQSRRRDRAAQLPAPVCGSVVDGYTLGWVRPRQACGYG